MLLFCLRNIPRGCLLLLAVLWCMILPAQDTSRHKGYYRFEIRYHHADSFAFENSFYLQQKDFNSYDAASGRLKRIPDGMIAGTGSAFGELYPEAGIGVHFDAPAKSFFGYPVRYFTRKYRSFNVYDSSAVDLVALGINPANAARYEYRLVVNDSVLLKDWSAFSSFRKVKETGYAYAEAGRFCFYGGTLLLEVRRKGTSADAGSVVICWPRMPKLFLRQTRVYYKDTNVAGTNGFLEAALLREGHAQRKDAASGVLKGLRLPGDKDYLDLIVDLQNVQPAITYKAILERTRDGVTDTVSVNLFFNEESLRVEGHLFARPGTYRLLIGDYYWFREPAFRDWVLAVPFEVLPKPVLYRTFLLRQLFPWVGAAVLLLLLGWWLYRRWTRRKLRKAQQEKEQRQVQLQNLQHQLNPHFLFNALSAIQNLIGRNDVPTATRYLTSFSTLTRTVLETSGQELISLEEELRLQRTYLDMEQLRFPFRYEVTVGEGIDLVNTDIPVMLLQPFVENAVKHGMGRRPAEGMIRLAVEVVGGSLRFTVADNGPGIQLSVTRDTSNTGKGLELAARRFRLLNAVYGEGTVVMETASSASGTVVTIQLTDWLT